MADAPLSPRNAKVALARQLMLHRKHRDARKVAVLEGVRVAEEALHARVPIEYVLYSERLLQQDRGAALLAGLKAAGVATNVVEHSCLADLSDTESPQGILAVFKQREFTVEGLPAGLVLLADQLQDPGNLGAIIRSMDALGAAGLVLCGGVDPYSPKVVRSAMGGLFRLPIVSGDPTVVIPQLKRSGRKFYLANTEHGSGGGGAGALAAASRTGPPRLPWEVDLSGSVAVAIGGEAHGASAAVLRQADGLLSIPMPGRAESLNASVAAGIVAYEAVRQRPAAGASKAAPAAARPVARAAEARGAAVPRAAS
jgi:TrmH family RNA methyltransferase